jgi:hypothetical protein
MVTSRDRDNRGNGKALQINRVTFNRVIRRENHGQWNRRIRTKKAGISGIRREKAGFSGIRQVFCEKNLIFWHNKLLPAGNGPDKQSGDEGPSALRQSGMCLRS